MLSERERFYRAIKLAHVECDNCNKDYDDCKKCWVYWIMNEITES